MLKELDWSELCDTVRAREINKSVTNGKKWNKNWKSEDKINLKEEEIMCGWKEIACEALMCWNLKIRKIVGTAIRESYEFW